MEQKIMNKIDKAVAAINKRIEEDTQRVSYLYDKVFTEEIRNMLDIISVDKYGYCIADDMYLYFDKRHFIHVKDEHCRDTSFELHCIPTSYSDSGIKTIEIMTNRLIEQQRYLDKIYETAHLVIDDIITRYRKETENQENRLDAALSALNAETKPVRRIKVTIEWI